MPSQTISATDHLLGQIQGSRQIVNWAFNEKEGSIKKFDLSRNRVVARLDKIMPSGVAPLSEVADNIRSLIMRDKKAEKIISELESKNITSLEDYAEAMNTEIDSVRFVDFNTTNSTNLGSEPVINAYAAYAPLNTVVGPLKGSRGVFALSVINRERADEDYDAEEQKMNLQSDNLYRLQAQAIEVLKDKMKVVDNRYKFY